MFFYASKTLGFFTLPSNILFTLALVGIVLMFTRLQRTGRALVVISVLLLAGAGLSPLGNALILPLEQRFPKWDETRGAPAGIVVLGGAVSPEVSAGRGEPALNEAAERMTAAAELARRYPQARIVFTGGSSRLFGGPDEARPALRLWENLGVPRERILVEARSRNTVENAAFSKELVQPKAEERWLLVTSAAHMPRSIGVFRKAGFDVEACPVDWRTAGEDDAFAFFASFAGGLARTDAAAHEWVGLLMYWFAGRTDELFPAPRR
jgi:uncharacterized SAM-binding protein YcdF (DUF218 family)